MKNGIMDGKPLKYNRSFVRIMLLLFLIILILGIRKDISDANKFRTIAKEDTLNNIISSRSSRGTLILNDSLAVSSGLLVLSYPANFKQWHDQKPIIAFSRKAYRYRLADIEVPYLIYKKRNDDLLFVVKNTDTLILRLDQSGCD